jgi:carboxylesterase type B
MGSSASSGLLPHPRVETSFGCVEGRRILLPGGRSIANVFLGVPFAKPPTGDRRLKVYSTRIA